MTRVKSDQALIFHRALLAAITAWFVGLGVSEAAIYIIATEHFGLATIIAVCSGGIAILAMVPGVLLERAASRPTAGYFTVLMASIVLRLIGTVALFVLCRYHMANSLEIAAILTIVWYVYLSTVEVVVLAKQLSRLDQNSRFAASSQDSHSES